MGDVCHAPTVARRRAGEYLRAMAAAGLNLPLRCHRRGVEPLTASDGAALAGRVNRRIMFAQLTAGLSGALDVFALLWLVLPGPDHDVADRTLFIVNAAVFLAALPITAWVGT